MSKRKVIGGTAILAVIVFAAIFGIMSLVDNAGKTTNQITAEQTVEELNRYVDKKVDVKKVEHPTKGTVDLEASSLQDELPEIGTYFYKVEGKGEVNIEIFSSPEKAGRETMKESSETDYNTWLVKVVEDFNK